MTIQTVKDNYRSGHEVLSKFVGTFYKFRIWYSSLGWCFAPNYSWIRILFFPTKLTHD